MTPLCVDLDGSLLQGDTLYESLLALVRQSPSSLLRLPLWLLRGKAYFKSQVAQRVKLNYELMPFHEELLAWLRVQKRQREMVLVTAADRLIAEGVAERLEIFDRVLASDGSVNLSGERKRAKLVELYGEKGYDYVGNAHADLKVWASARQALVVGGAGLAHKAEKRAELGRTFAAPAGGPKAWLKALRLHQWVKNVLIFVPLLLSHQLGNGGLDLHGFVAFVAFSLCASSVYVVNDLLDLDADRQHPRKRLRPFACGALEIRQGLAVAPLLLLAAFGLATALPPRFAAVLAAYYVATFAYSIYLKRVPLIDVMMLAGLYTVRMIAGCAATGVPPSFWLMAFGMSIFLSLGITKRFTELAMVKGKLEDGEKASVRGYLTTDLPMLRNLGAASGYGAVLILALYINSPQSQVLYPHPYWLWLLCPLMLYWISRVWLLAHRGQMHDDPIVFALRDRISLLVAALMVGAVLLAA